MKKRRSTSDRKYDYRVVEKKWQKSWDENGLYYPNIEKDKNPYYNLWMFPYPSAEGLHIGHAFTSTGGDIHGRFMRMSGKTVFQPTGYDAFGIHSENYALKIGENPSSVVERTTKHYEEQLKSLGHGYDWTRTVTTSSLDYYQWTEWLFATLFKAGLAYRKKQKVNFCPSCKTVLADEQVMTPKQAGKEPKDAKGRVVKGDDLRVCERCGTVVENKDLEQWFFRITDYAERLLVNLEKIDWTPKVKLAQKEWIGKSKGLSIKFRIEGSKTQISVWTKFWETVYGTTFLVVAPEYARDNLMDFVPQNEKKEVSKYIKISLNKSEKDRSDIKEKSGVSMGIDVVNPVNGRKVPVFVADYVLGSVGTGAVMGVPAHDERDFVFATKYKLPVIRVVAPNVEFYRSYLMGGKNITDKELVKLNIKIIEQTKSGRKIEIPKRNILKYEELVKSKMEPGYWNEYVGDKIVFIFKEKNSQIMRYVLKTNNERDISDLAAKYNNQEVNPLLVWNWLAEVDLYKDLVIHETGGIIENSDKFDSLNAWGEGKEKMAEWMVDKGFGYWETNYHLRDWLISRQRYWGCPIPMIYCETCAKKGEGYLSKNKSKLIHKDFDDWEASGWYPEDKLPVKLPEIKDWKPEGTGKGPLANHPDYYDTKCPNCGSKAKRETDVADTFLDSSWYFLRYPSVGEKSSTSLPFDTDISSKWLPVDLYFGGAEHAVLHLMYSRFVTMVMRDLKLLDFEEPFPRFVANGLVIKDGAKMSKSRGNVINPDEYIEKFGADTLRIYLVFMGPMDGYPDFRDTGIEGMKRFIGKLWNMFWKMEVNHKEDVELTSKMHQTIKKCTDDIKEFKYNTAIASIMEFVNLINEKNNYSKVYMEVLIKLMAPFTPHLAEEVWHEIFKEAKSVHLTSWPQYDELKMVSSTVEIIVQVNGKVRSQLIVGSNMANDKNEVIKIAKKDAKLEKWLDGKDIKSEIFVPGKLVNFVL